MDFEKNWFYWRKSTLVVGVNMGARILDSIYHMTTIVLKPHVVHENT